jgi:glycosyltransferase involved in cell wall biosynthesis
MPVSSSVFYQTTRWKCSTVFFYMLLYYFGAAIGGCARKQIQPFDDPVCMTPISVVIICKNEADIIGSTLQSLEGLTDDIVVYDNGSTDGTQDIVRQFAVQLHEGNWEGFGKTKHKATLLTRHEWVLNLDADEAIDAELKQSLQQFQPPAEPVVYKIAFKNFLGHKHLRYGEWGTDKHIRFYNKKFVNWNEAPVHEQLVIPESYTVKELKGFVLHRTMKDMADYSQKMTKYALLNGEKYFLQGKRSSAFKLYLAPGFAFMNYFFLKRGFLDGWQGYVCARMTAYYTFLKYARLRELVKETKGGDGRRETSDVRREA